MAGIVRGLWDDRRAKKVAKHAADQKIRAATEAAAAKAAAMDGLYSARDTARMSEIAHREALNAEKRRENAPRTTYAVFNNASRIVVTDFRAALPEALNLNPRGVPAGDGPLLYLTAGGGIILAPRLFVEHAPNLRGNPDFMAWLEVVQPLIAEAGSRYRGLSRLRDDAWLQQMTQATGLGIEHATDVEWSGQYAAGLRRETTVEMPTVAGARIARDGLRLRFRHRPGDLLARWVSSLPALMVELNAAGFTTGDLKMSQHPSGDFILALNDRDPASAISAPTGVTQYDAESARSLLGVRVADGAPAWLGWKGVPGCVIGGIPKSGKTSSMLPVLSGMAGRVELHLFDGKAAFDMKILEGVAATFDRSGELQAIVPTLDRLVELIKIRSEAIYKHTGEHDFWAVPPIERAKLGLAPIFLVVDEAQVWLNPSGKSAADKKIVEKVVGQIRTLIQQGRFVGFCTVITTQKPDANNIPTIIRDICENRIAFRTKSQPQSLCILGPTPDDAPEPHRIPGTAQGRCVAVLDEGAEELVQAVYVPTADLKTFLADKKPVPSQYQVAVRLLGEGAGRG